MKPKPTALVVDDHNDMLALMEKALKEYVVETRGGLASAIDAIISHRYDLIILDLALEDSTVENTLASLAGFVALAGDTPVIAMTGYASRIAHVDLPVDAVLRKPFTLRELDTAIAHAINANAAPGPRSITGLLLAATRAALSPNQRLPYAV